MSFKRIILPFVLALGAVLFLNSTAHAGTHPSLQAHVVARRAVDALETSDLKNAAVKDLMEVALGDVKRLLTQGLTALDAAKTDDALKYLKSAGSITYMLVERCDGPVAPAENSEKNDWVTDAQAAHKVYVKLVQLQKEIDETITKLTEG